METVGRPDRQMAGGDLELRLLGPLSLRRNGAEIALPSSRKVRALLARLALAHAPIGRIELCELLWDVPNDPRGELRWCLSKIRALVDAPERRRLRATRDSVALDLSDCFVDVTAVARATDRTAGAHSPDDLLSLVSLFRGDALEGLEIDRSPIFNAWLVAQRRHYRSCHAALLEELASQAPDEEALLALETLLRIAPFDLQAHTLLLSALARRGRLRDGEQHVEAAAKLFEADGLDTAPLREAWKSAKARTEVRSVVAGQGSAPSLAADAEPTAVRPPRRASIAVMPFAESGAADGAPTGLAGALAHDIITRLAKLRSLFVIAQGSVFALHERRIGFQDLGRLLGVDYVVGGDLLRRGDRVVVQVELAETRTARIIWAETFQAQARDTLVVLDGIGNRIVSSVVAEIELLERNRAVLKAPSRSMLGRPITAASGTCIASRSPTTSRRDTSSSRPCGSIRRSLALSPACHLHTGRMPSKAGLRSVRRSWTSLMQRRAKVFSPTIAIRRRTGPWASAVAPRPP